MRKQTGNRSRQTQSKNFSASGSKVPFRLALPTLTHQQPATTRWRGHAARPQWATASLHTPGCSLGLAGSRDEESFPSEETFTFLYPHVIKLQCCRGKHIRKSSEDCDLICNHVAPRKHGDPEQRLSNLRWKLRKKPSAQKGNVMFESHIKYRRVEVLTSEHPRQD